MIFWVGRLISDLVIVIVSATCGGIAFACAGQPVWLLFYLSYLMVNNIPRMWSDFMIWKSNVCVTCVIFYQVITGYLLAGSIIGPGGFNFVSEMVQVRFS